MLTFTSVCPPHKKTHPCPAPQPSSTGPEKGTRARSTGEIDPLHGAAATICIPGPLLSRCEEDDTGQATRPAPSPAWIPTAWSTPARRGAPPGGIGSARGRVSTTRELCILSSSRPQTCIYFHQENLLWISQKQIRPWISVQQVSAS